MIGGIKTQFKLCTGEYTFYSKVIHQIIAEN
jgi:hypothetical protein